LLIALFGVSLINAAFFGCTMHPSTVAAGVSGGYGAVACYTGMDNNAGTDVNTMACEFQYFNLTTNPISSHFHVGDDSTPSGNIVYTFDVSFHVSASGSVYQKFVASNTTTWTQQGGTTFDDQVTACASGGASGCYFNLHTGMFQSGELRCGVVSLSPTYDFTVALAPTPGAMNANTSSGSATVRMATVTPAATPPLHAWGYQVSFNTGSPVKSAHIHQGSSLTDNNGPIKVYFDTGPQRMTGKFVGVALEGVAQTDQPKSAWPVYTSDFDNAISNHFCYVNVHTLANNGGEIRANISPQGSGSGTSSASHVSLAIVAVFFMIASWMSLQ